MLKWLLRAFFVVVSADATRAAFSSPNNKTPANAEGVAENDRGQTVPKFVVAVAPPRDMRLPLAAAEHRRAQPTQVVVHAAIFLCVLLILLASPDHHITHPLRYPGIRSPLLFLFPGTLCKRRFPPQIGACRADLSTFFVFLHVMKTGGLTIDNVLQCACKVSSCAVQRNDGRRAGGGVPTGGVHMHIHMFRLG